MRAHAVINSRSGARDLSPGLIEQALLEAFEAAGHKLTLEMVEPGQIDASLRKAAGAWLGYSSRRRSAFGGAIRI